MTTLHLENGLLNDLWNINHKDSLNKDHDSDDKNTDQNIWSMNSSLSKINSNSSNSSTNSVDEKRFYYTNDYVYNPIRSVGSSNSLGANSLGTLGANSFNPMASQPFSYNSTHTPSATIPTNIPSAPVPTNKDSAAGQSHINSLSSTPSTSHSPQHSQIVFNTSPIDAVNTSPISEDKKPVNTQLYKTELCGSFMKLNYCPYGNKCQFAHGENELKSVERPANYRSKPCLNWSKYGSCRYGNRCCFKHGN